MAMNQSECQTLLTGTPRVLESLLAGLPEDWTSARTGSGSWSARDIVAHLVQGELEDWVPRARLLLEHGSARSFEPFDREGFRVSEAGRTLAELLPRFSQLRRDNLTWLAQQALSDQQLDLCGSHPAFGPVTLRQLLTAWAAHDLSHIAQVSRVLVQPLGDGVGPWREYLPIITR